MLMNPVHFPEANNMDTLCTAPADAAENGYGGGLGTCEHAVQATPVRLRGQRADAAQGNDVRCSPGHPYGPAVRHITHLLWRSSVSLPGTVEAARHTVWSAV